MAEQLILNLPDKIERELDAIARERGFANAKAMVKDFLQGVIRNKRAGAAVKGVREKAEQEADAESGAIG